MKKEVVGMNNIEVTNTVDIENQDVTSLQKSFPYVPEALIKASLQVRTFNKLKAEEIEEVAKGDADKTDNVLINSPHPQYEVCADEWNHSYPRSKAAFPLEWIKENKFWVNVARIDNAFGDRNLQAVQCNSECF